MSPYRLSDQEGDLPGIWRFRPSFEGMGELPPVTLGEGDTPLVWAEVLGEPVAFKLEYLNPTGSFKDRGTAVLVSWLTRRGVGLAVEDSSGNAGASFAAYAARAGIKARIYVPSYASGPKRAQIAAYGADVVSVPGPRSRASQAVQRDAAQGMVYASHAWLPIGLAGFATVAFELVEQLGGAPGAVICPAGQGSLLLGMARGFEALLAGGSIRRLPRLIGVQAAACAPLAAWWRDGEEAAKQMAEGETLAEGVRIVRPLRPQAVVEAVKRSRGCFVVVAEQDICEGRDQLAARGFYIEPTSAVVWGALARLSEDLPQPVVVILTGSGLKTPVSE
ncbi:MAG: pyridoxal-phosphate dependent enzyme [Anaerolineae bacterium]|nr:MAG: pyridoxal-phosphate dependent enzyme [Anaerolineae bacterium]